MTTPRYGGREHGGQDPDRSKSAFDWNDAFLIVGLLATFTGLYLLAGFAWTLLGAGLLIIVVALRLESHTR